MDVSFLLHMWFVLLIWRYMMPEMHKDGKMPEVGTVDFWLAWWERK
jgi:hypothetical protein